MIYPNPYPDAPLEDDDGPFSEYWNNGDVSQLVDFDDDYEVDDPPVVGFDWTQSE